MQRKMLVLAGHGFVGLGVVGAFVPVMPTTIFLILAAGCYARGNPALHQRLLADPRFGKTLRDWEAHRTMSLRAKVLAIGMIVAGIGATVLWVVEATWLRMLLTLISLILIRFLLSVPSPESGVRSPE